jgi:hypothetical protein
LIALREAASAGQLDSVQSLLFAETRPPEELYDLDADPWEIRNLATAPGHEKTLGELRSMLEQWMEKTQDQGRIPEKESRYDADMAAYQGRKPNPEVAKNIALMKQWARDGK